MTISSYILSHQKTFSQEIFLSDILGDYNGNNSYNYAEKLSFRNDSTLLIISFGLYDGKETQHKYEGNFLFLKNSIKIISIDSSYQSNPLLKVSNNYYPIIFKSRLYLLDSLSSMIFINQLNSGEKKPSRFLWSKPTSLTTLSFQSLQSKLLQINPDAFLLNKPIEAKIEKIRYEQGVNSADCLFIINKGTKHGLKEGMNLYEKSDMIMFATLHIKYIFEDYSMCELHYGGQVDLDSSWFNKEFSTFNTHLLK